MRRPNLVPDQANQRWSRDFVESFNGRPRDERLNKSLLGNLAGARRIIETWRIG